MKIGILSDAAGTLIDKHKEGMKPPSIAIYDSTINKAKIICLLHQETARSGTTQQGTQLAKRK